MLKKKTIISIVKQGGIFLALFLCMTLVMDFLRQTTPSATALNSTYTTINNKTINFSQNTSDKTHILYFWGSWCGVCKTVSPTINTLHNDGYPVMSVAMSSGTSADIQHYLAKKNFKFGVINDDNGHISEQWQIHAVPVIAFVKHGRVIHSMTGFHASADIRLRYKVLNSLY